MTAYRPLDPNRDWNFFHPNASIPETVLPLIRPLTEPSARELWRTCVSTAGWHTMLLPDREWPQQLFRSGTRVRWHEDWNTGSTERIAEVLRRYLPWPENTPIYFFLSDNRAVEVPWEVFVRYWPTFLFHDEGSILFSPRHPQAVVFGPNGHLYIGSRPKVLVRERRQVVAFDLDETLGVPLTDGQSVVGFQMRRGCGELLIDLRQYYTLVLWSVSSRRYVDKALDHGLRGFFEKTYSWDEQPFRWKDVRVLGVDWLVDDSEQHRQEASRCGIDANQYILVPAFGSADDEANPLAWAQHVRAMLLPPEKVLK
jgi:hypothetical protein